MALALLQVGQRGLAADHHGAGVDLVHQIEALGLQALDAHQLDGAGVVHHRVDTAEVPGGLGHRLAHGVFIAYVQLQGQCLAAGGLYFLGDAEDGAFEFRVGFGALGGDDDVGAVARGTQGDLAADAAAGAGDEEGLAVEGHGWGSVFLLSLSTESRTNPLL